MELRADLDTLAIAEALKQTERRLQIADHQVATLEVSLTRQQNLRMHGELLRPIDILAGGAAANHSCKKVFMQYCGAEREATLREPYLIANYQVQNLRQFVCDLEQRSQVRKLCITHVQSASQLDQLERLKEDHQRIEIEYQFSASLHEREFVLGSMHVVCDRGLDMYITMRRRNAPNTTVQSSVL